MNVTRNPITSRAFTLTELLVTIGIVGMLSAILLPVFSAVKMKVRRTQSQNNLRHLTVAFLGYELDYGKLMSFDPKSNGSWARHMQEREDFTERSLMSPLCNLAQQRGFGDVNTAWSDSSGESKYACITRI